MHMKTGLAKGLAHSRQLHPSQRVKRVHEQMGGSMMRGDNSCVHVCLVDRMSMHADGARSTGVAYLGSGA